MKPELFKRTVGRGDGNVNESPVSDRLPHDVASPAEGTTRWFVTDCSIPRPRARQSDWSLRCLTTVRADCHRPYATQ
ncbi:MAG: hypothetical protein KDJ65_21425 [Anaerolineae bacterium]|nr:hypothetical protein [Anaerolineae bacterium]